MKSDEAELMEPKYQFDLKTTDSRTFQQLPIGVYFITVIRPNVTDAETSVNLKGYSDEVSYTIH